jgi:hypothetical protein
VGCKDDGPDDFQRFANQQMKFTKMHGAGNDHVYVDCRAAIPDNVPELAANCGSPVWSWRRWPDLDLPRSGDAEM